MKKITFLINSLSSGGAEKVLSVLANELVKQGYGVEIIFLEKNEFYALDKKIKKTHLSNFDGSENGILKFLFLPILAWRLKRYIKESSITLIQSHVYRANYINILSKIFGGKHKTQIVIPGVVSFYKNEGLLGNLNLFLIKKLFPIADLIIWKSKGMQIDAEKLFNFHKKEIVIYNPCNLEQIENLANEEINDFEFKKDKMYLINIGRMESFKKHEWIIKALKFLPTYIELLLIGDGKNKEKLKKLANELKVSKRVHFLGKKKNPYKYLKKSDIFILSSENGEGFPNVIVEALTCGVTVISSDCISGPREILYPSNDIKKQLNNEDNFEIGDYGILYPVGDIKALKNAIEYLLRNNDIYKMYKNKSIERAKDFSIEKIIEKYEKILLEEI